jgi:hypothetical protein
MDQTLSLSKGYNNTYARTPTGNLLYPMKQYFGYDAQSNLYPYGILSPTPTSLGYATSTQNAYKGLLSQTGTRSGSGSLIGQSLHAKYNKMSDQQLTSQFPADIRNQK